LYSSITLNTYASQTCLCREPVTSSAEAVRPFVLTFKMVEVDGAYIQHLHFIHIVEAY